MIITDQASYSDQIFGLFLLLGYQFSPRPAGHPDQRFGRLDRHADYGPLDRLARHRINIKLIIEQWEDILRVAGSLSTGTVRVSELMGVFQGGGRPTRLGRAIAERGRVAKTLHLLSWIDSEEHRRQSSVGLTRHEGRHSVARVIFHGNQGELRQPYREGQEDQLGALGFALNALVLWNAQYLDDTIAHLRASGHEITDETSNASPRSSTSTSRCSATSPSRSPPKLPTDNADSYAALRNLLSVRSCSITTGRPTWPSQHPVHRTPAQRPVPRSSRRPGKQHP
jgi:TnpA family transposase